MISGLGLHFCELQGLRSKFSKTLETGSQDGGFISMKPRGQSVNPRPRRGMQCSQPSDQTRTVKIRPALITTPLLQSTVGFRIYARDLPTPDLIWALHCAIDGPVLMKRRGISRFNRSRTSEMDGPEGIFPTRSRATAAPPHLTPPSAGEIANPRSPSAKHQIKSGSTMRGITRTRGTDTYRQSRPRRRWPRDDAVPRGRSDYGEKFPPSRRRAHPVTALCVSRATTRMPRTRQSERMGADDAVQRRRRRRSPTFTASRSLPPLVNAMDSQLGVSAGWVTEGPIYPRATGSNSAGFGQPAPISPAAGSVTNAPRRMEKTALSSRSHGSAPIPFLSARAKVRLVKRARAAV
jgi:hypothetical protein